jgi:ATP/maltotriose-dependent transcriptional regulator MalT
MSILVDTIILPSRIGVPSLPLWAVPRKRLADRLDAAAAGPLTVISAPTGSGKTLGVAWWAWNLHPSVSVIWVNFREDSTDCGLLDRIPAEPDQRSQAVLVCDDFPAEPSTRLVQDLELLLSRHDLQLNIVLICSTAPTGLIDHLLGRHDLTTVDFDDLVMDQTEIGLVLDQHGVKGSDTTIRAVLEHTAGWAAGVGLAATALAELSRNIPSAAYSAKRQAAQLHTERSLDPWRGDGHAYDGIFVVPLTTRETEVLKLLAQLCSNEEIAADLVLSLNTVKTHMRSLFQKLSVSRRADAVRRGRALGLC